MVSISPSHPHFIRVWPLSFSVFLERDRNETNLEMGESSVGIASPVACCSQSARIYIATTDGEAVISLTVRPWFDWVKDLQAQVCTADTPSQRQQLFFRGDQLQDDGRVLALHGVIAECTIQLVSPGVHKNTIQLLYSL